MHHAGHKEAHVAPAAIYTTPSNTPNPPNPLPENWKLKNMFAREVSQNIWCSRTTPKMITDVDEALAKKTRRRRSRRPQIHTESAIAESSQCIQFRDQKG